MYYTTRIPIYQIFDVNQEIDHAINLNTLLNSYLLIEIQFSTMEKRQQKNFIFTIEWKKRQR